MLQFNFNNKTFNTFTSSGVLIVLITGIVIGQILLPYKIAQAGIPVTVAISVPTMLWEGLKYVYNFAKDAVNKAIELIENAEIAILDTLGIDEAVEAKIEKALNWAWQALRKKLLNMLVDDIVKWIQGGGTPRIVSDWQGFLKSAADQVAGQFIERYLGMGFLCKQFDVSLRILLATPPTFDKAASCSLSQINQNIQGFYDNIQKGGWKSWISVSETQNNMYGMYFTAQDYKWGLESATNEATKNEGVSSSGFLGDKVCMTILNPLTGDEEYTESTSNAWEAKDIPAGFECSKWQTRTPGRIAADAMSKSGLVDIDWLISADEFGEYAGAILDAVINRVIKEGVTRMTATSGGSAGQSGSGISTAADITLNTDTLKQGTSDKFNGSTLLVQLNLLKENLEKNQKETQTNLDIFNQIKAIHVAAFDTLGKIIGNNCPLISGVTGAINDKKTEGTCNAGFSNCPCAVTTTETYKLTATSVGEATAIKTTVTSYTPNSGQTCSSASNSYSSVSIGSSSADPEIAQLRNAIANNQLLIERISSTTPVLNDYLKAAGNYVDAYTKEQQISNDDTKAQTKATENIMLEKRKKIVPMLQLITGLTETDLQKFLEKIQNLSVAVTNKFGEEMTKRGASDDCSLVDLVSTPSYYKNLCDAKKTKASWDQALNSCTAATQNNL